MGPDGETRHMPCDASVHVHGGKSYKISLLPIAHLSSFINCTRGKVKSKLALYLFY
jgi:hypothetical protein